MLNVFIENAVKIPHKFVFRAPEIEEFIIFECYPLRKFSDGVIGSIALYVYCHLN